MDLTGAKYPENFGGKKQVPLPGVSLAALLKDGAALPPRDLHFSLFNNMAVVSKGWRLVTAYNEPWQLYDLTNDRTETRDLAKSHPEKLETMLKIQKEYEARADVRLRLNSGERVPDYAPIYKEPGKIGSGAREGVPNVALSLALAKIRSTGREPDATEMKALAEKYAGRKIAPKPKKKKVKK